MPDEEMPDDKVQHIPIKDLHQEDGAHELATSPEMQPYIRFALAVMKDANPRSELETIRHLPLERRYVWRVASALKWGFADFDDLSVEADTRTLTPEDFKRLTDLLKYRPLQFCIFLRALFGRDEMQRMMIEAIRVAAQGR